MKKLIINADDFGMSRVFNQSILKLARDRSITSTTAMVLRMDERQRSDIVDLLQIQEMRDISIGLHIEVVDESGHQREQIEEQFALFHTLFFQDPSHLDIHRGSKYPQMIEEVASFCHEKKLPCRNKGNHIEYYKSTTAPSFHGTVDDFREIEAWLQTLEENQIYEILFHPGSYDPDCQSSLNEQREKDNAHISHLNEVLAENGIKAISYNDFYSGTT